MASRLVIVESPAKAKTINAILGREYVVKSSMGHIRDLPVRSLGIDIEDGFRPDYVVVAGRRKTVAELKQAAKGCDAVYLAPDPDREGEAIAWHLQEVLKREAGKRTFHRVRYNEITPRAVREAFERPGEIDMHRVDAQQARRVLDRIVGYKVSPVLWEYIKRGLSAGRVQSVALRLVCEREQAILDFVPEAFWLVGARVRKRVPPLEPFRLRLLQVDGKKADLRSQDDADAVRGELEGRRMRVSDIAAKTVSRRASPPFVTSTLQQAGSSACRFSPRRTMRIAQNLYEGVDLGAGPVGLITYMRTDSFSVAAEAVQACRDVIAERFGREYCPERPNVFRSRGSAQEAHEAIRPTDVRRTPEAVRAHLAQPEYRLYRLIWERFVASQMAPARIRQRAVQVEALAPSGDGRTFVFQANSSEIEFAGYMKATSADTEVPGKKRGDEEQVLPPLAVGEELECLEWLSERKETKPPARYSEAMLVRALERHGIGRPSTYAQILSTLVQRAYVVSEKRTLSPTDLGMQVNALLVKFLSELFDVNFTASMEGELDGIAEGRTTAKDMLDRFYGQFQDWAGRIPRPTGDAKLAERVLAELAGVRKWSPEVKRGRRTYSDERFAASIRKQLDEGQKALSERQVEALLRIAVRYREQIPQIQAALAEAGREDVLEEALQQTPKESTLRKLALLEGVEMDAAAAAFVGSLKARVEGNQALTPKQVAALDRIVEAHADGIPGFAESAEALGLSRERPESAESGELIAALKTVQEWKPARKRGRRVFDDAAFFASLQEHFERRGFLSVRQHSALRNMTTRYRGQIANYADLESRYGLARSKASRVRQHDDESEQAS